MVAKKPKDIESRNVPNIATAAKSATSSSSKRVNFQLSVDQHIKLKIYAARLGKSIKELLTEYVDELTKDE